MIACPRRSPRLSRTARSTSGLSTAATRKGASKEWDYTCLINSLWLQAAQLRVSLRVDRAPSKLNVADLPSREQYWHLREIGASFVLPRLSEAFWKPDAWASLSAARAPLRRA